MDFGNVNAAMEYFYDIVFAVIRNAMPMINNIWLFTGEVRKRRHIKNLPKSGEINHQSICS